MMAAWRVYAGAAGQITIWRGLCSPFKNNAVMSLRLNYSLTDLVDAFIMQLSRNCVGELYEGCFKKYR